MALLRAVLLVFLVLTTAVAGGASTGHAADAHEQYHDVPLADDEPQCCSESTERGQSCHLTVALLSPLESSLGGWDARRLVFTNSHSTLNGINPPGPLEPPRTL